ncbi:uncharacterized protein LOC143877526 isoform X2 [Tasmannia lanceolata]|uniref:uncharacterized protein LOC143877526 isoform X2 n=1 Tax=Tasmannia lanceolata TaxID=3420 RepID=UPI004064A843
MAMRSAISRISMSRSVGGIPKASRYFSDGNGRIFSEEEKAAENIYIQKMERERLEKLKLKAEKEKKPAEKEKSEVSTAHVICGIKDLSVGSSIFGFTADFLKKCSKVVL